MLKYCKTVDSNSSRAQTPGGMPTSSVVVASSSAATIPLEPTTIEDKRPMTIDVRYVSAYKLLSIVLQTTITSTCSDVVFHMFLFHKVTGNSKIKTNSCYYS
ncbi:uncharacterized protein LOC122949467 [Acropora millepora]|nr:uncharacterized protein LOC122949467 [Acropora millepora]